MSLLEGLRFSRGDSFLHKLDPRVKFLATLVLFAAAIMFMDLIPLKPLADSEAEIVDAYRNRLTGLMDKIRP